MSIRDDVRNNALLYLKEVENSEKLKGSKIDLKAAACLLIASQESKIPKNIKDLM